MATMTKASKRLLMIGSALFACAVLPLAGTDLISHPADASKMATGGYNLRTLVPTPPTGDVLACWTEADGRYCGDPAKRPADSAVDGAAPLQSVDPGTVSEDAPGWDCRTNGNRTCGPDGSPYAPGCYVDGHLVAPWTDDMFGRWHNCGPITSHDADIMRQFGEPIPSNA